MTLFNFGAAVALSFSVLVGNTSAQVVTDDEIDGFRQSDAVALMVGEYEGPVHLKVAEIDAGNIGLWATYFEYRFGGRDQPVSRQRINSHGWYVRYGEGPKGRTVTPGLKALDIPVEDRAKYVGAADDPSLLTGALMADFVEFPYTCMMKGKREGDVLTYGVSSDICVIDNPELGKRAVTLEMTFSPEGMTIYEVGYDMDGNKLFGTDEPIFLKRVAKDG